MVGTCGAARLGRVDILKMRPQSKRERVLILGAGGHGRVVLDILLHTGRYEVVGFLDNNSAIHGRRVDGVPVHGAVADLERIFAESQAHGVVIAIGDNGVRRGLARDIQQSDIPLLSAIHPSATIASSAQLGRNVVVAAGVVVCANCQIGDSVILNTGCIIDYQSMIGEGSHICPGVRLGGRVKVEQGVFVGIAATIIPRVTLGCESIIGAGSVVLEDVPQLSTVVGVPAHTIRHTDLSADEAALLLPARI